MNGQEEKCWTRQTAEQLRMPCATCVYFYGDEGEEEGDDFPCSYADRPPVDAETGICPAYRKLWVV